VAASSELEYTSSSWSSSSRLTAQLSGAVQEGLSGRLLKNSDESMLLEGVITGLVPLMGITVLGEIFRKSRWVALRRGGPGVGWNGLRVLKTDVVGEAGGRVELGLCRLEVDLYEVKLSGELI
jgi:hypothetical protein